VRSVPMGHLLSKQSDSRLLVAWDWR
jgi:hypothetical protein